MQRDPRMRAWVTVASLCALLAPRDAAAMGVVLGRPGETVSMQAVRMAVATAPGRTTLWGQVSVTGASGGFVWIVPVRSGARVELASDAWLDALDAATSSVVLPPLTAPGGACAVGAGPAFIPPATSPRSSRPVATAILADAASVGDFVSSAGCALPQDVASALGPLLSSGLALFAARFASASLPARTVRIVDGGPAELPLGLTGMVAAQTRASVFVVAPDGATMGASPPLSLDPRNILWTNDEAAGFVSQRQALIEAWGWLTECAAPGLFVTGAPVEGATALPAVEDEYRRLAAAYGDATGDAGACDASFEAGEDEGGGAGCSGPTDDASLALASLVGSSAWVTRVEGIITPANTSDVAVSIQAMAPRSPVFAASGYDAACQADAASPGVPMQAPLLPPPAWAAPPAPSLQPDPGSAPPDTPSDSAAGAAAVEGCGAAADACANSDSSGDSGSGCGGSDTSGDASCAATGRARRSPASRVLLLLAAAASVARRRARRPSS